MSRAGKYRLKRRIAGIRRWARRHIPPGLRLVLGLLLMLGGLFGFLPVIGFWMFPLGVLVAALDVMPIWRALRGWWQGRRED